MPQKGKPFRVGRVRVYLRGRVWYLCYHENGRRRRPRAGTDRAIARRLAAETNAQLEVGAPSLLSFEKVSVQELRERWLLHHEQVRRSSVHTVRRYRAATEHLVRFVEGNNGRHLAADASRFALAAAEEFVGHLRKARVSPNGHPKTEKRSLRDKGVLFILGTCRAIFSYASKHRHLSPYAENPFGGVGISRMPVEDAKPIRLLTPDEERRFLEACDDWQFPVFLTLMMTGLRPGELTHLLLPNDLDLEAGVLRVTNKQALGWQVKTRSERELPLAPVLVGILRQAVGERDSGPVFRGRRFTRTWMASDMIGRLLDCRVRREENELGRSLSREERQRAARKAWVKAGLITNERLRREFMRVTKKIGLPELTTPKTLRHMFATYLQDANVDPLIRMQLMGHSPMGAKAAGPLGMTAVYTHTKPETRRRQLLAALDGRACTAVARDLLRERPTLRAG